MVSCVMLSKLLVGVAAAFVLLSSAVSADVPKNIVTALQEQVVQVFHRGSTGTAWYVTPQYLVTNRHVISGGEYPDMITEPDPVLAIKNLDGSDRHVVVRVAHSQSIDMALLYCATCPEDSGYGLPVLDGIPAQGTSAYSGGYGLGEFSIEVGHIQQTKVYRGDPLTLTSIPTISGDSGSPVLIDTPEGIAVAGMRTAIMVTGVQSGDDWIPNLVVHKSISVPSILIAKFIDEVLSNLEQRKRVER